MNTLKTMLYTLVSGMLVAGIFLAPNPALADEVRDPYGLREVGTGVEDTLGDTELIPAITNIINIALGLLGIIAVVIILIGGFRWMTAAGREDQVDSAKKTIFAGIIGLAIILSSWALATFVIDSLAGAVNAPTDSSTDLP